MCGCHGGIVHCKAEYPGECFHAGQWYSQGPAIRRRRGSQLYTCQRGQWSRAEVIPTTDAYAVLTFARGSVELTRHESSNPDLSGPEPQYGIPIDIRAWIDPAEGKKARQLARERARRVQARLIARGFTKAQASITLHHVPPGAPVNDVSVTLHAPIPTRDGE